MTKIPSNEVRAVQQADLILHGWEPRRVHRYSGPVEVVHNGLYHAVAQVLLTPDQSYHWDFRGIPHLTTTLTWEEIPSHLFRTYYRRIKKRERDESRN